MLQIGSKTTVSELPIQSKNCAASFPEIWLLLTMDRPIMALVGGLEAPPGRIMGHAGAWAAPGEPDAQTKYRALERAGAVMVNHPEKFGVGMRTLLGDKATRPGTSVGVLHHIHGSSMLI